MPVAYKCRGCGIIRPQTWEGRCPNEACGGFYNIKQVNDPCGLEIAEPIDGEVVSLQDAINHRIEIPRLETGMGGIDHVLGGGFAKNGMYLLCGDPGIGKTTILIQTFQTMARLGYNTLFVTGEQTVNDVALRAQHFGKFSARMTAVRETKLDRIMDIVADRKPDIVAIDSVQTLEVDSDIGNGLDIGSPTAVRTAARILTRFSKDEGVCLVLVGHVTKDGAVSGPKALEHYVDACLYFAGNTQFSARQLRCDSKNRYAPTPRIAKFDMTQKGLVEIPEEEDTKDDLMAEQTAKAIPVLKSIPLDIDDLDKHFPNPNLASFWVSPDGTNAAEVLAVRCDVPECRGAVDRACTSANGTLESGFHEARITKAKLKLDPTPKPEVVFEQVPEPDPFDIKPLKAKPRIRKPKKPSVDE